MVRRPLHRHAPSGRSREERVSGGQTGPQGTLDGFIRFLPGDLPSQDGQTLREPSGDPGSGGTVGVQPRDNEGCHGPHRQPRDANQLPGQPHGHPGVEAQQEGRGPHRRIRFAGERVVRQAMPTRDTGLHEEVPHFRIEGQQLAQTRGGHRHNADREGKHILRAEQPESEQHRQHRHGRGLRIHTG